ncbi:MAG: protein kinase, partial [Gemmatimonadales bacterium]
MVLTGIVDDRYSIEREVGRGGMATVYLARDLRHGNRVAVKVLTPDFASVVGGERFTREIRITAGLQHPHILPVFDSGEVNGLPYYVMPFVDGPTIEQKIRLDGAMPPRDALEIACEVADALQHAHAQGFVHRDVKPSNILLAHGHAVVADFGVARTVEAASEQNLTRTGIAVGTAAYMSPEQAAGEQVDGRSDIYSLGCVLYEMISGHPPFAAATPRALMAKHWREAVPPLMTAHGPARASVDALVRKALSKSASDRFQTAAELSDAIQRLSSEERFISGGSTPPEQNALFSSGPIPAAVASSGVGLDLENTALRTALTSAEIDPAATDRSGEPAVVEPLRRRKRGRIVFAGLVIVAAAFAAWKLTRPAPPALDPNRVMVYPLIVPEDFRGSHSVGEDLGTMIGTALDGAGPLKWIDAWPLLPAALRQDIRNLPGSEARSIARSKRAAYYMIGRVVARGDSADVFLELNDVAGDSTVARGNAGGLASDAWRSGLRAVNQLLPTLIP